MSWRFENKPRMQRIIEKNPLIKSEDKSSLNLRIWNQICLKGRILSHSRKQRVKTQQQNWLGALRRDRWVWTFIDSGLTVNCHEEVRGLKPRTHQNLDSFLHHQGGVVCGLTDPHHGGHSVFLQLLLKLKKKTHFMFQDFFHSHHHYTYKRKGVWEGLTSMNLFRVALVGLWVMRNLMFLYVISTGAGLFIRAMVTT